MSLIMLVSHLLYVDEFKSLLHREDGTVKPVLIILVHGGPDENPRYRETIKFGCAIFLHLGLDALGGGGRMVWLVLYNLVPGIACNKVSLDC